MPLGLYVHIPFCSAICNYCNFNRGLFDGDLKNQYVAALLEEIRGKADGAEADTVFFGGGTPSLLEPGEVRAIIEACRNAFAVSADAEVTLEANPETVTPERLEGFRAAGVNRLSFGVQSFRDEELQRLSRLHSAGRAREAFGMARAAGFDNVSLDLMMWLPQQAVTDWLVSVEGLIGLGPEHASLYLLEIYPNAPLRDAMARGQWSVAADEDAAEMYLQGMALLDEAGYEQVPKSRTWPGPAASRATTSSTGQTRSGSVSAVVRTRPEKACGRRMLPPHPSTFPSSPREDNWRSKAGSCPPRLGSRRPSSWASDWPGASTLPR